MIMAANSIDLGLSLSLTSQSSLSSSTSSPWNIALASIVDDARNETDERTSLPDSPLSGISGKRTKREEPSDDRFHLERTMSGLRSASDEEEDGEAGGRKKLRLSKNQAAVLEECFKAHSTLNPKQKLALANKLNLRPRQVEVWFQNRRARTKLKQTEVDCEYLKRWCERLAEENKKLEKEVAELRALKMTSPSMLQSTGNAMPLTTLTMCSSCRNASQTKNSYNCNANSAVKSAIGTTMTTKGLLPTHCQLFPVAADRSNQQHLWNLASTPVGTRELF